MTREAALSTEVAHMSEEVRFVSVAQKRNCKEDFFLRMAVPHQLRRDSALGQ